MQTAFLKVIIFYFWVNLHGSARCLNLVLQVFRGKICDFMSVENKFLY